MTDAEMLRGAQAGSADAWRALHQRVLPSAWRQAYALVANVHAAEDIVSETMLALLRGLNALDADAVSLAAWMRTVVRRKAMDHHRWKFRQGAHFPADTENPEACAVVCSPSEPLELAEARDQTWRILDRLSERQRTLLQWKYNDRLSVREIAERLGETEKAVESNLYRARQDFRREFQLDDATSRGVGRLPSSQTLDPKP